MMKIVIIGSSSVSVSIIENIRTGGLESEITLISLDGHYPYRRDKFTSFLSQESAPENIYCRQEEFYEKNNVKVVLDRKISRINLKRKKIFTEEKHNFDYDILILTDTSENRYPDIKGTGKTGVYGYKKLRDIDRLTKEMMLIDTAAIQSDSFAGLQAATAIAKRGREVIVIASKEDFLGRHFEGDALPWIITKFEEAGIRVLRDQRITEVLGDKDAKAVRLNEEKVFSCEAVLFMETDEDLRLFSDTDLQTDNKIKVDKNHKTNIDSVFAVDQTSYRGEPVTPQPVLEQQAKAVIAVIAGQKHEYTSPLLTWELEIGGLSISVIGQTALNEQRTARRLFDEESGQYQALYVEHDRIIGAVLVNSEGQKQEIITQVEEKTPIEHEKAQEAGNNTAGSDQTDESAHNTEVSPELIDK